MDESSLTRHQIAAADQPHGEHGHFAPKPDGPFPAPSEPSSAQSSVSVNSKHDTSFDEPLVSVSINNPFKKLLLWLDEIRKKQTTEFDINAKLKIPLLGWAILVGVLFGVINVSQYLQNVQLSSILSKYTTKSVTVIVPPTAPTPILISRMGVLKASYQLTNIVSHPTPNPISPTRYMLVTSVDEMTFLTLDKGVTLTPYLNKQVLVTGFYDAAKNTLHIHQDTDIQYVP